MRLTGDGAWARSSILFWQCPVRQDAPQALTNFPEDVRTTSLACSSSSGRTQSHCGLFSYHGPPRWHEIEGIEEPPFLRAKGVEESLAEIVDELRQADMTPTPAELNAGANCADEL